jgi:hypothetical protein
LIATRMVVGPLMGELRAIEFIARLIDQGRCRAA